MHKKSGSCFKKAKDLKEPISIRVQHLLSIETLGTSTYLASLEMKDINTTGLTTATVGKKVIQPRLLIQALAFTGILYFIVSQTPPETTQTGDRTNRTSATVATSVADSILQHASQQSGLPASALRIVRAQPQTWSDNCLGLRNSIDSCTPMPIQGWQVAVASDRQHWIYRTDASGSVIKVEQNTSSLSKQ